MKQRAKLCHRNECGNQFTQEIIVRHLYSDMTPETLSFWDDAVFIVNDYRVALWWDHASRSNRRCGPVVVIHE
jgi:hypothetical protein